jgi:hypothetical protein
MSESPRPALGELARLATAAKLANWWFPASALERDGFHPDTAEFIAACSPAVILQLVALATGGATAMQQQEQDLDKTANGQPREPPLNGESPSHCDHCRREVGANNLFPIPTQPGYWWCAQPGPCSDAWHAAQRAARSLTPERPADAR